MEDLLGGYFAPVRLLSLESEPSTASAAWRHEHAEADVKDAFAVA
jgi:hypothetical protein